MKLYRIHYSISDGSHGFSWHTSRREAKADVRIAIKENNDCPSYKVEIEKVEFPLTKKGILRLLIGYATYPDNG